jgi:hypothetical protein
MAFIILGKNSLPLEYNCKPRYVEMFIILLLFGGV